MPARNTIKTFVKNRVYHIYNRGVEKRVIFQDEQDHRVFLNYLKEYLSPPPQPKDIKTIRNVKGTSFNGVAKQPKNYNKVIELWAYCLMPNHFHLLIKQNDGRVMENFMRSLATRYSMYFNKKYSRVGPLFQGIYKAVGVDNDNYLLHLSRYIHLNPSEHTKDLVSAFSSYANYINLKHSDWVNPTEILKFFNNNVAPEFKNIRSYQKFVEDFKRDSTKILGDLILE